MNPLLHRVLLFTAVCCVLTLASALVAPSAEARMAVVRTDDGSSFRGEFVRETETEVVLNVNGIDAIFKQDTIVSFVLEDTPEEIYRKRRAELEDQDLAGRLDLAEDLIELDDLPLAKFELNSLDRDFPEHPVVLDLLAIVNAKQKLAATVAAEEPAPAAERPTRIKPDRPGRRGEAEDDPFLTPEQINLIRVYEIDLNDKPRVEIDDDTVDAFFQKYAHRLDDTGRKARVAFRRLEGYEQLDALFAAQARDLYERVEVRQEPTTLSKFRRSVNPRYVARYFAPTFGHGQIDGLSLFNQRPETDAEAYTNFYRLSQFRYDGKPMIDRANPELSLLVQWGLERDAARFPAPDLPGWRPFFRSTDDSDFRRIVEWIDTLFKEDLDYGITPRRFIDE